MSKRRDPPDIDDLLNENGGEIGDLYRRLPRYEPPRRLDRAVLGEAARAVHSGKPPRRQRWMVGIGSAAGLVLAAGIAWRIGHDAMNQQDAAAIGAQRQTPIIVPVEPVTEPARKREAPAQETVAEPPASAPAPASAAKSTGELARNAAKDEPKQSARDQLKKQADISRKPLPPVATPAAPPPAAAAAPQAFPEADRERSEEQAGSDNALDSRATAAGAAAPADKQKEFGAMRPQPGSSPPSSSIELRRDTQRAPEDWLAHIHLLLREGRRQQATESLQLFQRAHPDWAIPDDLRPLLK